MEQSFESYLVTSSMVIIFSQNTQHYPLANVYTRTIHFFLSRDVLLAGKWSKTTGAHFQK